MADYKGNVEEINDLKDWKFYKPDELQTKGKKAVDNFMDSISLALQIRERGRNSNAGN